MTRSLPWTPVHYANLIDPQPREPGNGSTFKSPNRPRPPKPVQPRDDGCSRMPNACFASGGGNDDPQPRDPGNGRHHRMRKDPQPRDPGNGRHAALIGVGAECEVLHAAQVCGGGGGGGSQPPREPRPPQPREGGRRFARAPQPRDPG